MFHDSTSEFRCRFMHVPVEPGRIEEAGERFKVTNNGKNRYVTMNRFSTWRCEERLVELNANYVDIDYYKTRLKCLEPRVVFYLCLERLVDAGMPPPSIALFSGRGLLLIWLHSPIPPSALPRWKSLQSRLHSVFHGFGVDRSGANCVKVFRIPGSVNYGNVVKVLYPSSPSEAIRWEFEDLAREILPWSRSEAKRKARPRRNRPPKDSKFVMTPGFRFEGYWTGIEREVHLIRHLRYSNGYVSPGERDLFLFVLSVCAAWTVKFEDLHQHLRALFHEVAGWSEREVRSVACTVLRKAEKAARGEKVKFRKQSRDPRYTMRGTTVAEYLNVTPDEVRRLDLLLVVPSDLKKERRKAAVQKYRRRKGVVSRDDRRDARQVMAERVHELRSERMTWRAIADALDKPVSTLHAVAEEFPDRKLRTVARGEIAA
jgi:hypothetical protein